jgi:group I intron endonuclease
MIIYEAVNKFNLRYIGATTQRLATRISEHKSSAYTKKLNGPFYDEIRKSGLDSFNFRVIESCNNKETLAIKEKYWIKRLNSRHFGYNNCDGGYGPNGFKYSKDQVLKRNTTKHFRHSKEFMVFNKLDGNFLGIWFDKKECSNIISEDHSYLCKILNGQRTSPRILAEYLEV